MFFFRNALDVLPESFLSVVKLCEEKKPASKAIFLKVKKTYEERHEALDILFLKNIDSCNR